MLRVDVTYRLIRARKCVGTVPRASGVDGEGQAATAAPEIALAGPHACYRVAS